MASALWLGSMEPQWLAPFLSLPVQVMVTPEMMVPVLPGQRFFTPSDDRETIAAAISGRDIYYLSVTNWESVVIPANHGRLLALGQVPPPPGSPVGFLATPPDEQYPAYATCCPPPNRKPSTSPVGKCAAPSGRRTTSPCWKGWAAYEGG